MASLNKEWDLGAVRQRALQELAGKGKLRMDINWKIAKQVSTGQLISVCYAYAEEQTALKEWLDTVWTLQHLGNYF